MNERLKQIIFKKLYNDLSNVEIISYNDSIWFINRENKYWYFEYTSVGLLWWRFDFFKDFFNVYKFFVFHSRGAKIKNLFKKL